ncbi:RNA-binding protein squid-like [Uranotaenia lowii]|uniref:RNA-binding protein squid-like n=1 Tax=Uranotaenia lowii TaxID=190385 RepID=UPI002478704B|nr:RNA-binding protein squid-like [Uranotaenia lowii]
MALEGGKDGNIPNEVLEGDSKNASIDATSKSSAAGSRVEKIVAENGGTFTETPPTESGQDNTGSERENENSRKDDTEESDYDDDENNDGTDDDTSNGCFTRGNEESDFDVGLPTTNSDSKGYNGKGDSSIFVGNAPIGIKVEKIKSHFSKYGKIKKCTVIKDKHRNNKFNRTYPPKNISAIIYIDFTTEESARNACEENQKMFESKRLRVSLARERKPINKEATLFVGNLKYTTTEEQLYDAFIQYGEIDMVRIIAGKGFGFVHFANTNSVDKAVEKNKSQFNGREIHVEKSRPAIKKEMIEPNSGHTQRINDSSYIIKKQQAPGGYLNFRRNQTRNQLALELLERVINVQCKRPKSGIKF